MAGHYDRKLKARVSTWVDRGRTLVGFLYEFDDSDECHLYYWEPQPGKVSFRLHKTKLVYVDDPAYVVGRRLESMPDPLTDEVVNTFDLS